MGSGSGGTSSSGGSSSSTAPPPALEWEEALQNGSLRNGFPNHAQATLLLDKWAKQYPSLVRQESIGSSLEGREILAFVIGSQAESFEGDAARLLVTSLIHAREYASLTVALYWMGHSLAAYGVDPEITFLLDTREVWLIPFTNIDGFIANEKDPEQMIRKNQRPTCASSRTRGGVDLNRNFDYHWEAAGGPCNEEYSGEKPFSEPETRALRDLVDAHRFSAALLLHSYGSMLAHPFAYATGGYHLPPEDKAVYDELSSSFNFLLSGTIPQILNYTASGEAGDWLYGARGIISMTAEVGPESGGFQPPRDEVAGINQRNFHRITELARKAGLELRASVEVADGWLTLQLQNAGLSAGAAFVHLTASGGPVQLDDRLGGKSGGGIAAAYLVKRSQTTYVTGSAKGSVSFCAMRASGGCLCGNSSASGASYVLPAEEPCATSRASLLAEFGGDIRPPWPGKMVGSPPDGLARIGASSADDVSAAAHVASSLPVAVAAAAAAAVLASLLLLRPVARLLGRRRSREEATGRKVLDEEQLLPSSSA